MNFPRSLTLLIFVLGLSACTEAPVTLPLRSLERSGEVSFLCVGSDHTGRDINSCPDFENEEDPNHLYALVTQTQRGEVAVVDLSEGEVLDLDKGVPGFDFLPVGQNPRDIVSSADGRATFVGIGDVQNPGIFALPTSCIQRPAPDLTAFPACALPAAPGDMALVADPLGRLSCDDPTPAPPGPAPTGVCPEAQLSERLKIVATLPERGELVVIDAQWLLDQPQGSFDHCKVERWVRLADAVPAGSDLSQPLPPDLAGQPQCIPDEPALPTKTFISQPGGAAFADGTLYVADRGVPIVHSYDLSDPCAPTPLPPLLPVSHESSRIVTTSRVAVSPITSKGERFVYAIDELEGSVMVFDVTPGQAQRTPLVRPGAPRLPFEPADRIALGAPARDLTFALRDVPIVDPATGVATIGTYCDPIGVGTPGAAYRTSLDYNRGAAPRELRGVFAFIALTSGQVAVIDVEDFDAPCRRPISSSSAAVEDFRGCAGDPASPEQYLDGNGQRTVSGEASCKIVQPHRARSGTFVVTSPELGVHAPSLRNFPQLEAATGGTLPTGPTDEGKLSPKLLAVDFQNPEGGTTPAQVFVGTTLYQATAGEQNELITDPALAERPNLSLILNQPRAFAVEEEYRLIFEGAFVGKRPAGFIEVVSGQPTELSDADAAFCGRGVQDVALTRQMGEKLGVDPANLDAFSRRHADYVQITSELVDKDDVYWDANACGGEAGNAAFFACKNLVGTAETPGVLRDLRILEAYQNRLVLEPRAFNDEAHKNQILDLLFCCFGKGKALEYQVRSGQQWVLVGAGGIGFRHNVSTNPGDLRCVRDECPRRALLNSRALEISSAACPVPAEDQPPPDCNVGPATPQDVACVLPAGQDRVAPSSPCVFENLTHRFAVYRGTQPTVRDTAFSWQIAGGFITLGANLAAQTAAVSPQSLVFVPQLGQLAVVDGAAEGLVLVSLDSVSVSRLFF